MINIYELFRNGFKIVNGDLCDRHGTWVGARVQAFGWGEPCYKFDNYDLREFSIKKDGFNDWWLYQGYSKVCELKYYGGKNWATLDIYW